MTTSQTSLRGTALITGASSGIGAIYADRLARRGFDLVLVARDANRLASLASHLGQETGRDVAFMAADLTRREGRDAVEVLLRSDSRITMLVNNAGVGATQPLLQSRAEDMESMVELNVTALMRLAHAAAPNFAARGRGAIINIGSIVALAPELLNGVYAATKAFVLTLSQSLHHELSARGVQVQAVLPGATSTDFWNVAGLPVSALPQEIVMTAEQLVDASLVGFDAKELVTIPSLPDPQLWETLEASRLALGPHLSRSQPAERYLR